MWWSKEKHLDNGPQNAVTRCASAPTTSRRPKRKISWQSFKPATIGSRRHEFEVVALPPLPSPFPSPSHSAVKSCTDLSRSFPLQRCRARRARDRPATSSGISTRKLAQQEQLQNAAFIARERDWISSHPAEGKVRCRETQPASQRSSPASTCRTSGLRDESNSRSVTSTQQKEQRAISVPRFAGSREDVPLTREGVEVLKLRHVLNMSREAMSQAYSLFSKHAENTTTGLLKDRQLTMAGFKRLWLELVHPDLEDCCDVPREVLKKLSDMPKPKSLKGTKDLISTSFAFGSQAATSLKM